MASLTLSQLHLSDASLLTDLYQLTMSACYVGEGLHQKRASFELFARRLPENFGYLVAMGLAEAIAYLEALQFTADHIDALRGTGVFDHVPDQFWDVLADARFEGDVWAVPEGTVAFANEPLLRIEAPLWQAQLVETYLLNTLNYQTLVATRAARLRDVAGEDTILLEFGTRRAFSPQASLWAARAALAAGMNATSNVLASMALGYRPSGTMAHSLVMALEAVEGSETQAFTAFHRYFPNAPLLIDTYDTVEAARTLAQRVQAGEIEVSGVRLDSGDLVALSQKVRSLLPAAAIFASGDLDEYEILRLKAAGACIDGYGLGTRLVTGAPVNGVYKLVDIDGIPTMKASSGKGTYPGRKQVFRQWDSDGGFAQDRLALAEEPPEANEEPLLLKVMEGGKRLIEDEALGAIAHRAITTVRCLSPKFRTIHQPAAYIPQLSPALTQLTSQAQNRIRQTYTEQQ